MLIRTLSGRELSCSSTQLCQERICGVYPNITPNCSTLCQNGVCYQTNITPAPGNPTVIPCDVYQPWSACFTYEGATGCDQTNHYYTVRFCQSPANSVQYQIACCYPQVTGPTGGGSTPPPATPILCNQLYYCRLSDYQCNLVRTTVTLAGGVILTGDFAS